jgi:hypothetical protein
MRKMSKNVLRWEFERVERVAGVARVPLTTSKTRAKSFVCYHYDATALY